MRKPRLSAYWAIPLLLSGGSLYAAQGDSDVQCSIPEEEQLRLLALSWEDFDQAQSPNDLGWRRYQMSGCYVSAAELIDRYFEAKANLTTQAKRVLRFHAGQMYTYAERYVLARERFLEAFRAEPESDGFPWNDYVHATIAFIDRDLDKLRRHRERIAATESQMNLQFVDRLINFFEEPYMVAYTGERRTR